MESWNRPSREDAKLLLKNLVCQTEWCSVPLSGGVARERLLGRSRDKIEGLKVKSKRPDTRLKATKWTVALLWSLGKELRF